MTQVSGLDIWFVNTKRLLLFLICKFAWCSWCTSNWQWCVL